MTRLLRSLLVAFVCLPVFGDLGAPATARADYGVSNGYFFTATGGGGDKGFTVKDDGTARFWSEFNRMGGIQATGYPISVRFNWDGFVVQAMQRLVLQWRPDVGQAYPVNVFDIMHDRGLDDWLLKVRQTPLPLPPDFDTGLTFEQSSAKRLALLDANPAIKTAYYATAGDPIAMNGLPASQVTDMGNHWALRAQRVVFQQWKEAVPWASAGEVTVALGGSIAAEAGLLPKEALVAEATAGQYDLLTVGGGGPQLPAMPAGGFAYGFQVDQAADYDHALRMTSEAGFGWVKMQVPWKDLEPQPGQINWAFFDNAVLKASSRGLRVLFSVTTAPMWARPGGADSSINGPPASPDTYARFVGAVAARYKGKVAAFEIWNEQNLSREWGGPGRQSAADYVALLQASYRSIKAADPNALVLTGALTPAGNVDLGEGYLAINDLEYFQQMYDAGAKGSFDGAGVHPGGFNNAPGLDPRDDNVLGRDGGFHADRSFYFRNFEFYREIMVRQGDAAKPLWFTEFGWASGPADNEWAYSTENSEQTQADDLVQAFQIGRGTGYVAGMVVWNLNHFSYQQALQAFAVVRPDWSPRPAYTALARMQK